MKESAPELIHVVEDDDGVARLIVAALERFDFRVERFARGADFLKRLQREAPQLCILDLGLPDMDGIELLQKLRGEHRFGLLILTGRSDTYDRVMGLELGADDYVAKPFEPRELVARVRSILRRYQPQAPERGGPQPRVARFSGWTFEFGTHRLTGPDGRSEDLSLAEAQILMLLLEHPNQILSREHLLAGRDVSALDRSIDLRISRLRRRLEENPQHARIIKTVYGAGYLLSATVEWDR